MRSFIIAWVLLFSVILFVSLNAFVTVRAIDEMTALAETIPLSANDISYETDAEKVHTLAALWDRWFPYIAFTAGYTNTERCDQALGALTVYFGNRNFSDFAAALSEFHDALLRLRILEGFHIEGIF
ncbi:MAG: hypothetical protein IJ489_00095 [Clostridia bacterium]|nr:hypothetical protein [Clostridia bacterium]